MKPALMRTRGPGGPEPGRPDDQPQSAVGSGRCRRAERGGGRLYDRPGRAPLAAYGRARFDGAAVHLPGRPGDPLLYLAIARRAVDRCCRAVKIHRVCSSFPSGSPSRQRRPFKSASRSAPATRRWPRGRRPHAWSSPWPSCASPSGWRRSFAARLSPPSWSPARSSTPRTSIWRSPCIPSPSQAVSLVTGAILRGAGDVRRSVAVTVSGSVTALVVSPALIFWAGLGLEGAAWALLVDRAGQCGAWRRVRDLQVPSSEAARFVRDGSRRRGRCGDRGAGRPLGTRDAHDLVAGDLVGRGVRGQRPRRMGAARHGSPCSRGAGSWD